MAEKLCDLALDYFNGHLDENEKIKFENHLETCEECKEDLNEWNSFMDSIPYQVEPVLPPPEMKQRVLNNILSPQENRSFLPTIKKHRWLIPSMAAALIISLAGNVYFYNQNKDQQLSQKQVSIDQVLKYASLNPIEGKANGTISLVKHGNQVNIVIQASQLQTLKKDEVYQVWLLENEKPYRAGTFISSASGDGTVIFKLDEKLDKKWDTVAITLEPNANSDTPKGSMVLASEL